MCYRISIIGRCGELMHGKSKGDRSNALVPGSPANSTRYEGDPDSLRSYGKSVHSGLSQTREIRTGKGEEGLIESL